MLFRSPIIVPGLVAKPEGDEKAPGRKRIMGSKENKRISHPKKRVRIDDISHTHPPGVRRSPRINPHLFEANKLLSLQTIIAENFLACKQC